MSPNQARGLFKHDGGEGWTSFRPFAAPLNRELRDPNAKFIDLNRVVQADLLVTEDEALVWHASFTEVGCDVGGGAR